MPVKVFNWTQDALDMLRACIADRLPDTATAAVIGQRFDWPLTRNSVIGKAHRLGLSFDSRSGHNSKEQKRARAKERRAAMEAAHARLDAADGEKMANFKWTDAAKELLRKCVDDRLTARQAAAVISERFDHRVSRESALKKALSLGWGFDGDSPNNGKRNMPQFANGVARVPKAPKVKEPKPRAVDKKPQKSAPVAKAAAQPPAPAPEPIAPAITAFVEPAEVVIPASQRVTLDDLRNGTCRWPVARDDDQWMFCGGHGANFAAGRPYCGMHAQASHGLGTPSERRAVKDGARAAERAA